MGQVDKLNLCFLQVNKIFNVLLRLGDRKRQLPVLLRGRIEAELCISLKKAEETLRFFSLNVILNSSQGTEY